MKSEVIRFKRNHFSARLPIGYLYSLSHFWLHEESPGSWRVGLTSFATRMLGEIVELDFEVEAGKQVSVGDVLGWIEGFKAVSDIYSVAEGEFSGGNPIAAAGTDRVCSDPYGEGWLYRIRGKPDPGAVTVQGYIEHLERTIDKIQEKPWQSGEIQP
ncbi:MAG TPA: glycine cleavage system protein H [Planctomycetota bacterium]|nr:glycine cleavage system protein H [Planctomycetota bacterium]